MLIFSPIISVNANRQESNGTIYKLPRKRSKLFRAVKTDKWGLDADTGKSKQIRFPISYYATREEAIIALAEYNENPYDIKADSITFSEVYKNR